MRIFNTLMNNITKWCKICCKIFKACVTILGLYLLKGCYNDGHNILRLFDTIPNFLFTKSEAKRDY